MGKPVARLGDTGSHGGSITTGASSILVNGKAVARVGDIYDCPKHGPNPIVTGAQSVFGQGQLVAHVGSKTACGATIISGSPDTFVGTQQSTGSNSSFATFVPGAPYDERVRVVDEGGNVMKNVPYFIKCPDGSSFHGLSDENGFCGERIYTEQPEQFMVYLGLEALERWPENDTIE